MKELCFSLHGYIFVVNSVWLWGRFISLKVFVNCTDELLLNGSRNMQVQGCWCASLFLPMFCVCVSLCRDALTHTLGPSNGIFVLSPFVLVPHVLWSCWTSSNIQVRASVLFLTFTLSSFPPLFSQRRINASHMETCCTCACSFSLYLFVCVSNVRVNIACYSLLTLSEWNPIFSTRFSAVDFCSWITRKTIQEVLERHTTSQWLA